jgi:hypothetical protein
MNIGDIFNPNRIFDGVKIPYAISRNNNLSPSAKLCYGQLCRYTDDSGVCNPSQSVLAEDLGISERQIRNIIKELEDNKFIVIKPPTGEERLIHINNQYIFPWHPTFEQESKTEFIYGPEMNFLSGEETNYPNTVTKDLNLKSKRTESLVPKELRSFLSKDSSDSTQHLVESVLDGEGLGISPTLIKRKENSPIVFEKIPRQQYRSDVLDIINYWNSSPGLTHHKTPPTINGHLAAPTKTFLNAVSTVEKVIDGKFFTSVGLSKHDRVYTKREIITSIDRFKLMATNPSYLPVSKEHLRHIGINVFFYNPYSDYIPSTFLKCLEEEPKPVMTMVERQKEKNPQLTIWLKDIYREKVLLGIEKEFNPVEENKIIKGANRLHEVMRKLQSRMNMMTRPIEWAEMFIDALVERWGREKLYPGHLCTDHSFDDVLVRYLKRKGRLG